MAIFLILRMFPVREQCPEEIQALQAAMLRARAMGFDRTADAMARVLAQMVADKRPGRDRILETASGDMP
ncbi:hypothetical protein CLV78_11464 [Aliiruegeria haliotis]|uniref:Uncharacterized protein n=1 Tax=Aliiruegeria haliotis TaxID=1280846 RepID=A0A2T0RGL0_9RHOB|nr:hypothetical protein [Aliiruegeria haliotis]PRY20279.1 hypothetical protein CLV78_11464 [Aliiruegeria haliotis]